jgi:hypothetical protein
MRGTRRFSAVVVGRMQPIENIQTRRLPRRFLAGSVGRLQLTVIVGLGGSRRFSSGTPHTPIAPSGTLRASAEGQHGYSRPRIFPPRAFCARAERFLSAELASTKVLLGRPNVGLSDNPRRDSRPTRAARVGRFTGFTRQRADKRISYPLVGI